MSLKKYKILVVVESINPNDSSGSKANLALIQNLFQCNYNVKVLHYTRRDISLDAITCIAIKEQKWHPWYILSKVQILIWRWFKINLNPFFEKRWGFSFCFFSDSFSIKRAINKEKPDNYDWVLTLSKAASFRPHHAMLKCPQWHHKWLAYIHDPYPMHFYPRPYNWVVPGYHQQEEFMRAVSEACTYGIFPSKLLQEWMGSYFPNFLARGMVIPHQIIQNIPLVKLPEVFSKNTFIILHAGSLMKQRDPKGLVEGFELFLEQHPDAKAHAYLYLVGNMNYHQTYLLAKSRTLGQLLLEDHYVNFNTVYNMQQAVAVNVVLEAKAEISPFLPGKIPHVVAAKKPILHLGPALSETRRILGEDYPYWSEVDDKEMIADIIEELYNKWGVQKMEYKRTDLESYLGLDYLKFQFDKLFED
jgi:glycosyltransferase involved in cell wall biosynthesis